MASKEVLSALESLHRELEKLEPAIKHVETAQQITQTVKGIPVKHEELLKEVKTNDAKHKSELKELFSKELNNFTGENKKLQKVTSDIQQQVKAEQEALAKLKDTIMDFHERVEKINFPERLDKVDATVAGIAIAVQNVQGRLDLVEANVKERIKDAAEKQATALGIFQEKVQSRLGKLEEESAKHFKNQQITLIATAVLMIILFLVLYFVK